MADVFNLDWSEVSESYAAGIYHAEVQKATLETAKSSGDKMLKLELKVVGGRKLCYDNAMLSGPGKGIGMAKLIGLGVEKGAKTFDAGSLVGRRCYVAVEAGTYTDASGATKTNLKVDIKQGPHCGYWMESERAAPIQKEEAPF